MADGQALGAAVQDFLFQMWANGRSRSSVHSYGRELDLLTRCLCDRPLAAITSDDVSRFLAAPPVRLRRDGGEKAATTLNRTKSVIRAFFTWCERSTRVVRNPAFFVRSSPTCAPSVRYMTPGEVRRFLSIIRRSDHPLAPRDYALFSALAYTGVRLSEITGVTWADLDGRRCLLRLRCAKGGRVETRHVPRRLLAALAWYHRRIDHATRRGISPMFVSRGQRALTPRGVQYRFTFWLARSGIRRRMSVHSLRHHAGSRIMPGWSSAPEVSPA